VELLEGLGCALADMRAMGQSWSMVQRRGDLGRRAGKLRRCAGLAGCQVELGRLGEGHARWLSRWQVGRLGWVKGTLAGFWCSSTGGGPRVHGTLSCGAKRDAGSEVRVRLLLRPWGGALTGGATRSGKQGALRGGKKVSSCKWDRP
jgi:hypothetical protein